MAARAVPGLQYNGHGRYVYTDNNNTEVRVASSYLDPSPTLLFGGSGSNERIRSISVALDGSVVIGLYNGEIHRLFP